MVPVSTFGMDEGSLAVIPQVSGARGHGRGSRPAGGSRPFPQREIKDLMDERENAAVRPLSVEAEEFSLGTGPRNRVTAGVGLDGGGDFHPSRTGSRVIRCDAAVSTAAEAGAAAIADIAGTTAGTNSRPLSRYIPRLLTMRVILQLSVPIDSGALLL